MNAKELGSMPIGTVQGQAYLHPDTGLPRDTYIYGWAVDPHPGISLRQHYAGLAMQGLLANPYWAEQAHESENPTAIGVVALYHADVLLAELAKEP